MLNLITQEGTQKRAVDSYEIISYLDAHGIYGSINGKSQGGPMAAYGNREDAIKVFRAMVIAESRGLFIKLPDDDPKEITSFCTLVKTTSGNCFGDKIG